MSFFFISVFTISQSASTVWYYTTLKHTQVKMSKDHCFSTLWNYTTLKQSKTNWNCLWVSVPYEITLLSNNGVLRSPNDDVSVRYEITLLSNLVRAALSLIFVSVPYEITLLSNNLRLPFCPSKFQYLMKLHYSQTLRKYRFLFDLFQYLMKLHYSQTVAQTK